MTRVDGTSRPSRFSSARRALRATGTAAFFGRLVFRKLHMVSLANRGSTQRHLDPPADCRRRWCRTLHQEPCPHRTPPTTFSADTTMLWKLRLTQPKFAGLLPVSVRTLATLEKGMPPTDPVARRLTELERLTKGWARSSASAIGRWLKTPNPAFGGL